MVKPLVRDEVSGDLRLAWVLLLIAVLAVVAAVAMGEWFLCVIAMAPAVLSWAGFDYVRWQRRGQAEK